jgi:hypothetical protein
MPQATMKQDLTTPVYTPVLLGCPSRSGDYPVARDAELLAMLNTDFDCSPKRFLNNQGWLTPVDVARVLVRDEYCQPQDADFYALAFCQQERNELHTDPFSMP